MSARMAMAPRPMRKTKPIPKTEAQKASLAEWVAEGGAITAWSREHRIDESWAWQLWNKVKRDLGWQAQ